MELLCQTQDWGILTGELIYEQYMFFQKRHTGVSPTLAVYQPYTARVA